MESATPTGTQHRAAIWADSAGGVNVEFRVDAPASGAAVFGAVELSLGSETIRQKFLGTTYGVEKFRFQAQSGTLRGQLWLYGAASDGQPPSIFVNGLRVKTSVFGDRPWYVWEFRNATKPYWFQSMSALRIENKTLFEPSTLEMRGRDFSVHVAVSKYMVLGIFLDIPDKVHQPLYQSRCT
jgi:hypothetical protein